MKVLVLSRPLLDATADLVITELRRPRIAVHRLDPGEFPEDLAMSAYLGPDRENWQGVWRGQHRDLRLDEITAVYYRRPGPFRFHPDMGTEATRWANDEARAGFGGVLTSLRCRWVNHPHDNAMADVAPRALATARRCGLRIPRTLITNDPAQAREFIRTAPHQVAAYKALAAASPRSPDGRQMAVWTSRVRADDITEQVSRTAHQFQEWIDKVYEVRVTCVGRRVFAAEIHAGSEASRIDFRRDYESLTYRICAVPQDIANGLRRLMDAFRLRYLACDFLVNRDNDWFLVDINPNGQYGFVPALREPITHAIADELEGNTPV
ncbi:ATP-grasp ribosomal peptide maturase [Streptomyces hainanensis]|uniref:ATP-grasp ribosomal peptide maturase n=1 Tax=Streptomyces hainanensis TaxID=402648 RepID=A0A4R4TIB8_9ACTN|nr:ATP-grasp ribosomal peptide maturase [Streptomyces hainanensis]TDC75434.1 ATP-grasp ribosomal peptide maturase [Streptomyces hainanensis]